MGSTYFSAMNVILFDHPALRQQLLPFTFTRPAAGIRIGILSIAEKWERYLHHPISFSTIDYLSEKFPVRITDDNLWINGALCPDQNLAEAVRSLQLGEALVENKMILAVRTPEDEVPEIIDGKISEFPAPVTLIDQVWKIYQQNGAQIRADFALLTHGRKSASITDPHTKMYAPENIFVEEGAVIKAATLNAENGPIYLGRNSAISEGAIIRGPFALCEGSQVNMGAKVRGDTTVGPFSKIGGEVSNSVIFGYSNKAHDGFLGNSVIGEWCNIGADSNTSNLKNNYENVKIWSFAKGGFVDSGLMFCGLMFGDHSKCGINTMFNSGTVVGVSASVFGAGYPRNFIPSFAWGGAQGFTTFQLNKALATAEKMMERRNLPLSATDRQILTTIYHQSAAHRVWERNPEKP
jgi:UDP-N-acetylglucosamine diphosphorylase/glucosamine-1-phosphate N-acetyltransferase